MSAGIIGHYERLEKVGEGGMGEVFKAIHPALQRAVAIKSLRPELITRTESVDRFCSEAIVLAGLNHPNIASLYDFLQQGDEYFMVMEFIKGIRLDEMIQRQGAIDWRQASELMCQALDGLEHAHERAVIHRDIKPANLMLDEHSTLKLIDFGIARRVNSPRATQHGHLVGTLAYMSPEQVKGHEVDARSDVYGLGAVFYELLTGQVPFDAESDYGLMTSQIESLPERPSKLKADVPNAIETIVLRALSKKPKQRFQSAAEFRAALESVLNQNSRVVKQAIVPLGIEAMWREYPGVWVAAALALIALGLIFTAGLNQWGRVAEEPLVAVVSNTPVASKMPLIEKVKPVSDSFQSPSDQPRSTRSLDTPVLISGGDVPDTEFEMTAPITEERLSADPREIKPKKNNWSYRK